MGTSWEHHEKIMDLLTLGRTMDNTWLMPWYCHCNRWWLLKRMRMLRFKWFWWVIYSTEWWLQSWEHYGKTIDYVLVVLIPFSFFEISILINMSPSRFEQIKHSTIPCYFQLVRHANIECSWSSTLWRWKEHMFKPPTWSTFANNWLFTYKKSMKMDYSKQNGCGPKLWFYHLWGDEHP